MTADGTGTSRRHQNKINETIYVNGENKKTSTTATHMRKSLVEMHPKRNYQFK